MPDYSSRSSTGSAAHFARLPLALRTEYLAPNVTREMVSERREQVELADKQLRSADCAGCDMIGWLRPERILGQRELARLKSTAQRLREETDVLLLIGIGGSYLGARAIIEALADDPNRVVYAGQNISAHHLTRLRSELEGKRVAMNVISKSGTTTEPAVAFQVLKDLAGISPTKSIVVTTDASRGILFEEAERECYERYAVPNDIGGRYSVLSAVGLLPIAYAGVDVDALLSGATACAELSRNTDSLSNPAYFYATVRNILYQQGFSMEILAPFEARLHVLAGWWKQLFGESEGKDNMGIYPSSVDYTADLHSLGQYVQEGRRTLFETFLTIEGGEPSLVVPERKGMGHISNREVSFINRMAYEGTALAHREGGVPNLTISLEQLDAFSLGALIYFFEITCAISGLLLGVNPFDQPGVETYKKHVFRLLQHEMEHDSASERGLRPKFVYFG